MAYQPNARSLKRLRRALGDEIVERMGMRSARMDDLRSELAQLEAEQQEDQEAIYDIMGSAVPPDPEPVEEVTTTPTVLQFKSGGLKPVRTVGTQTAEQPSSSSSSTGAEGAE